VVNYGQLGSTPLNDSIVSTRGTVEPAKQFTLCVVLAGVAIYDALLAYSIAKPERRFWPPPPRPSWRHEIMRAAGVLGPISIVGMLALGLLDWDSFVWRHWSRFVIGGLLFVSGGGFALWGFCGLGLTASQGFARPLLISGAYRYSRNPQYVGAVAGLLGYGLVCNSTLALATLVLWSSWYLLAPFAEEPWLLEHLGAPYAEYAAKVRRYL
jgi:protein-S-isoprenylcysteine O-methyltransferase Ste14